MKAVCGKLLVYNEKFSTKLCHHVYRLSRFVCAGAHFQWKRSLQSSDDESFSISSSNLLVITVTISRVLMATLTMLPTRLPHSIHSLLLFVFRPSAALESWTGEVVRFGLAINIDLHQLASVQSILHEIGADCHAYSGCFDSESRRLQELEDLFGDCGPVWSGTHPKSVPYVLYHSWHLFRSSCLYLFGVCSGLWVHWGFSVRNVGCRGRA